MERKTAIRLGVLIGTTLGSYIPVLWGDSFLSYSSVFFGFIGGIAGVWAGFKISS